MANKTGPSISAEMCLILHSFETVASFFYTWAQNIYHNYTNSLSLSDGIQHRAYFFEVDFLL